LIVSLNAKLNACREGGRRVGCLAQRTTSGVVALLNEATTYTCAPHFQEANCRAREDVCGAAPQGTFRTCVGK
jgi:hypothetical protein